MDTKEKRLANRRGFVCAMSGMLSGLVFASPTRLLAKKAKIKNLLINLEAEILEKSRPTRHPSITCDTCGDTASLYMETKGEARPMCSMNQVGKTIWEACDGKNSPRDISILVHNRYQVSSHEAYVDCLAFLARLKAMGAIQL